MLIDEIKAMLAAKANALVQRSAADMAALIHRDFIYVTAGGRTLTKADYIDVFVTTDKVAYRSQTFTDLALRQFEGFTVATLTTNDDLTLDGRDVVATFNSLYVFTKPDSRWLWAAGQAMQPKAP